MKIDTAPWVKACTEVDMDELYTELALERLENQAKGTRSTPIRNYKEMFGDIYLNDDSVNSSSSSVEGVTVEGKERKSHPKKRKGKKILLKGDPGMGKTTLMKKIGWDWAKGFFTTFSIVFFVFLKLVEPGEVIENIIVRHTPALEGMSITPQKLRQILEQFSERCLLILDGLDEHALGKNEDVLKIIRGQKLLFCNIIVTSRPHSTGEVERYFRTVANIQGFGRNQAKTFASRILDNKPKVDQVMNFTPSGSEHLQSCPIIFLILCVLVKEDEIDLQSKTFTNGELYFRLVRFLYRKHAVNKGIDYQDKAFVELLKKLGKIAWETLREGNSLLQRSRVIREIGEEAFDYGILIGNEDFRLIAKEAADILVTFPHRTLQEFLGSYHFVLRLSEGENIDSLLSSGWKVPQFMLDSLFLHFCLWWSHSDQKYISLPNRELAFGVLRSYVLERLDVVQFEPEVINRLFPSCDVSNALKMNDVLRVEFLKCILLELQKVKSLVLREEDPIDFILESMAGKSKCTVEITESSAIIYPDERTSKSLLRKMNWAQFFNNIHSDGEAAIFVVGCRSSRDKLDRMLKYYKGPVSVYLFMNGNENIELSELLFGTLRKLYIINNLYCSMVCKREIPKCPLLTHLSFVNIRRFDSAVDGSVMSALSRAVKEGNLPKLTHLSFDDCLFNPGIQLSSLLETAWPNLTELNLTGGHFDVKDFKALSAANKKGLLPVLKSLFVCDLYKINESAIKWLFKHPWPNLTHFVLDNMSSCSGCELTGVLKQGKLIDLTDLAITLGPQQNTEGLYIHPDTCPNLISFKLGQMGLPVSQLAFVLMRWKLQKLDISFCLNITRGLCSLFSHNLPSLTTLIMKDCDLIPKDLSSLGQASVKGTIQNLRHLDISRNLKCAGHLESLFDASCSWNDLLSLDFTQSGIHEKSKKRNIFARDLDVLCLKIEDGFLRSLEEVSFTAYMSSYPSLKQTVPWKHVRKINILDSISQCPPGEEDKADRPVHNFGENLRPMADMVESGILPSLEVVSCVVVDALAGVNHGEQEKYQLAKSNVLGLITESFRESQNVLKENF